MHMPGIDIILGIESSKKTYMSDHLKSTKGPKELSYKFVHIEIIKLKQI